MTNHLLIEIGVEELPSSYMPELEKQLRETFQKWLKEASFQYESCQISLTPRRIVFYIASLEENQQKQPEWVKGPPVKAAFTGDNQETPALTGFLHRCRSTTYEIRTLENGQYIFGLSVPENSTVPAFFSRHFPSFLTGFPFEKQMRWGHYQFIRPVKWVLALYGNTLLPMTLLDTDSGLNTRLLQGQGELPVTSPENYFDTMHQHGILLSVQERVQAIQAALSTDYPVAVVTEDACRTEVPVVVEAAFPASFTSLPKEILETVLLYQMKCFPWYDLSHQALTNRFYFVMNGNRQTELVKRGFEKVMTARLSDAAYFYTQDRMIPFSSRQSSLSKVMFMEKLGTMEQKVQRMTLIAEKMQLSSVLSGLSETIRLYKLDLTTLLVQELTELQGIVGRIYALESGVSTEIAHAIEQSYQPKSDQDELPSSLLGQWISLLDRWDTWIGIHSIQYPLSSSGDPLGIRRTVNGFLQILRHSPIDFRFDAFLQVSIEAYQTINGFTILPEKVHSDWEMYFFQRMRSILSNQYRYDLIQAVMNHVKHPHQMEYQLKILEKALANPAFKELCQSFVRMQKILNTPFSSGEVNPSLLESDAETILWKTTKEVETALFSATSPDQVLYALYPLNQPIQRFFDEVMVMVESSSVRENRLRLLSWLLSMMSDFADLSKIVFEGGNEQ